MASIRVVGMGPGDARLWTQEAKAVLERSPTVLAVPRIAAALPPRAGLHGIEKLSDAIGIIAEGLVCGDVAVCVSGDPGLYSMLGMLRRHFPQADIQLCPGIGSLQYLCDRLGESREEAVLLSAHGRELPDGRLVGAIAHHGVTLLLLDAQHSPTWLCAKLLEYGLEHVDVAVGEQLSYPEESIICGTPQELVQWRFSGLCAARIRNDRPLPAVLSFGLRDDAFVRGDVPMTKAEVRAVALSKLDLDEEAVVWDIGAGTGSVAVECARLCRYGIVHAVERQADALELIRQNREQFGLHNLLIHSGEAPAALAALPHPTHVFVGGSGGELPAILAHIAARGPGIRVVVAAVTLETIAVAAGILDAPPYTNMEIAQISISRGRKAGPYHLMTAQNPVTLIDAWTGDRE